MSMTINFLSRRHLGYLLPYLYVSACIVTEGPIIYGFSIVIIQPFIKCTLCIISIAKENHTTASICPLHKIYDLSTANSKHRYHTKNQNDNRLSRFNKSFTFYDVTTTTDSIL